MITIKKRMINDHHTNGILCFILLADIGAGDEDDIRHRAQVPYTGDKVVDEASCMVILEEIDSE